MAFLLSDRGRCRYVRTDRTAKTSRRTLMKATTSWGVCPVRTDFMGLRVARWRDIGGLTQQQLADAVGVTREYISMIENGHRPVTKRSLLISLAQALGVSITDLTGQPYEPVSQEDLLIYSISSGVRTALDSVTARKTG